MKKRKRLSFSLLNRFFSKSSNFRFQASLRKQQKINMPFLTLRGTANSTIVFLQNISKQMTVKSCKVCSKLRCSAAQDFVHKKVLVLIGEILFSNNKNWLFEPNDAIFTFSGYNYAFSGES